MIQIKNAKELDGMRKANALSAAALKYGGEHIEAGMTTWELDKLIYDFIVKHGGCLLYTSAVEAAGGIKCHTDHDQQAGTAQLDAHTGPVAQNDRQHSHRSQEDGTDEGDLVQLSLIHILCKEEYHPQLQWQHAQEAV